MKTNERPILFSGEMVRAILDGRKTVTRRVLKVQPIDILPMKVGLPSENSQIGWITLEDREKAPHGRVVGCRYGRPGDRLWVRETWQYGFPALSSGAGIVPLERICPVGPIRAKVIYQADGERYVPKLPYRPSIHMPRWASRITLKVTGVRVERVQEITSAGAIAEGVDGSHSGPVSEPREDFAMLWDSLNAKRGFGWDKNPWVWVVEFRRLV